MKQLLEFQKKVSAIKKDGKNPHFKSTYATLTQMLGEVKPVLSECGLIVIQPIRDNRVGTVITDGDKLTVESWIELPTGISPQQLGAAITYFRRYTLAGVLSLEIEDDDSNSAQNEIKPFLPKNGAVYQQAVKFLVDGGAFEAITKKYTLSEETEKQLKKDAGI